MGGYQNVKNSSFDFLSALPCAKKSNLINEFVGKCHLAYIYASKHTKSATTEPPPKRQYLKTLVLHIIRVFYVTQKSGSRVFGTIPARSLSPTLVALFLGEAHSFRHPHRWIHRHCFHRFLRPSHHTLPFFLPPLFVPSIHRGPIP